jgi:hypothetical protein
MTLKQWADNGWLRPHRTSPEETENLLNIVDRDLADAQEKGISEDWRFGILLRPLWKLTLVKQSSIQFSESQKVLDCATILLHNDLDLQHWIK